MTNAIRTPLLLSLAVGLVACAGGGSDPDGLRSAPAAVAPTEQAEPASDPDADADAAPAGVVANNPAPAVAQWRPWMDTEVERLRAERPDYFDQVMGLPTRTTRAGFPRLTGPLLREPDAAPILLYRLLSKGEAPEVRAAIIDALPRTTGDYSAALAELMTLETEPRVRELIAASLYRAQAPFALDGLALGLADANASVRAEAARSVGRRSDGAELADEVVTALGDADETVQIEAARALGNLQVASAKDALVAQLSADSSVVRRHSLRALSRIDAEFARGLPQLEALRSDADPKLARVAETIASGG